MLLDSSPWEPSTVSPAPATSSGPPDPLTDPVAWLAYVADTVIAMGPGSTTDEQIGQITQIERITNASAGLRAEISVAFAVATRAEQLAANVSRRYLGRGIVDELGLARGISGQLAASSMKLANQLATRFPLPGTALKQGLVSERTARIVVTECRHLSDEHATHADHELDGRLVGLGPKTVKPPPGTLPSPSTKPATWNVTAEPWKSAA